MELYKWQRDCLDRWTENTCTGIVNVVTGAGKTVFALAAMDRLREKYPELRVRIVVPTVPLARQWESPCAPAFSAAGRGTIPTGR